jgi:hypothetical protein
MTQRLNISSQSDRQSSAITVIADEDACHIPRPRFCAPSDYRFEAERDG